MFKQFFIAAALIAVICSGCQEAIAPIGPIISLGVLWKQGEASKYYATEQEVMHKSVKAVLDEFKIHVTYEELNDRTITLKAGGEEKGEARFKIYVVAVRENITRIGIRVNTFGDKEFAELIFRHIDKQQGVEQFATVASLNEEINKQRRPRRR